MQGDSGYSEVGYSEVDYSEVDYGGPVLAAWFRDGQAPAAMRDSGGTGFARAQPSRAIIRGSGPVPLSEPVP